MMLVNKGLQIVNNLSSDLNNKTILSSSKSDIFMNTRIPGSHLDTLESIFRVKTHSGADNMFEEEVSTKYNFF